MALEQDISTWLDGRKAALVQNYNAMGLKASGNWEKELTSKVEVTPTRITATIDGSRYTEQLLRGRKVGKWPPRDPIRKWIDEKGITPDGISKDSLAFLIQRKIGLEGIQVPNPRNSGRLVSDAFPESEITNLTKLLVNHFKFSIRYELINK